MRYDHENKKLNRNAYNVLRNLLWNTNQNFHLAWVHISVNKATSQTLDIFYLLSLTI